MRDRHLLSLAIVSLLTFNTAWSADIVWVHQMRGGGNTGDGLPWEDDAWRQLIEGRGHSIVAHDFYDDSETLGPDEYEARLELFESADLVMFSRDSNSGDYNDVTEYATWTSDFSTPLIVMTPYVLRNSRWDMVNNASITDATNPMEAVLPDHPIFDGIELDENGNVEFWTQLGADDQIDLVDTTDFGFAEVIAVEAERGIPWIAYWDGEAESGDFYDASTQFAGGPRLFLSAGSDDDPNTWGEKNITPAGDQIVLNAITFLTGDPGTVVMLPYDCNSDGIQDAGDLSCILASGGAEGLAGLLTELDLLLGDLDADGSVGFPDFPTLSANFGQMVNSYPEGDTDGDGSVGFPDFLALSANFGQMSGGEVAAVPEPTGLAMALVTGICLVLGRRSRQG